MLAFSIASCLSLFFLRALLSPLYKKRNPTVQVRVAFFLGQTFSHRLSSSSVYLSVEAHYLFHKVPLLRICVKLLRKTNQERKKKKSATIHQLNKSHGLPTQAHNENRAENKAKFSFPPNDFFGYEEAPRFRNRFQPEKKRAIPLSWPASTRFSSEICCCRLILTTIAPPKKPSGFL